MKNKKSLFVVALLFVVLVMSVGYASLTRELTINGGAEITGDWNVKITNIEATNVGGAASAGTPTFDDESATFNAELKQPGDSVTYTVTITNAGEFDATLADVVFEEAEGGSPAIIYTHTQPSTTLAKGGTTTTMEVTATFDPNYTTIPEVTTKTVTGKITYEQSAA